MAPRTSFTIKFDDKEFRTIAAEITLTPAKKMNLLKKIGVQGERLLQQQARTQSVTGTTERSIAHEVINDNVSIYSNLQSADISMETGRRPGKMPPVAAIAMWALKKGIAAPPFLIARKIARVGTEKFRRGGPKLFTAGVAEIERFLDKLIDDYDIEK